MRWTEKDLELIRNQRLGGQTAPTLAAKLPKYRNTKVIDYDGLTHDSRREYRRWNELKLCELAGEISCLRRQVVFDLIVRGVLVCRYVADAVYVDNATGMQVVEDTKSEPTRKKRDYRLKKKLMKAVHNIEIREYLT